VYFVSFHEIPLEVIELGLLYNYSIFFRLLVV